MDRAEPSVAARQHGGVRRRSVRRAGRTGHRRLSRGVWCVMGGRDIGGGAVLRKAVGGLVAITLVLSPWEAGLLPEPLDRLGAEPAQAQAPAVERGTPEKCDDIAAKTPARMAWLKHPAPFEIEDKEITLPWVEHPTDKSLCWVETYRPCPLSPLSANQTANPPDQMMLSPTEVGVCQAEANNTDDSALVAACLRRHPDDLKYVAGDPEVVAKPELAGKIHPNAGKVVTDGNDKPDPPGVPGFVNRYDAGSNTCLLLHPASCPPGLVSVGTDDCRGYQRRGWICPTTTHPTKLNRFNKCGAAIPDHSGVDLTSSHPACASGAPDLGTLSCNDYVGNDFLPAPVARTACDAYDTAASLIASPPDIFDRLSTANPYWCKYKISRLYSKCAGGKNPTDPDCNNQRTAACIMRATGVGGCDGIARTMLCRDLQAAYATARDALPLDEKKIKAALDNLRDNDCQPCVAPTLTSSVSPCDYEKPSLPPRLRVDSVNFESFAKSVEFCGQDPTINPGRRTCNAGAYAGAAFRVGVGLDPRRAELEQQTVMKPVGTIANIWGTGGVDEAAVFARYARQSYTAGLLNIPQCVRKYSLTELKGGFGPSWRQIILEDMIEGKRPDYRDTDIPKQCRDRMRSVLCEGPTMGKVDWRSQHASGVAVAGVPITIALADLPLAQLTIRYIERAIHLAKATGSNPRDRNGYSTTQTEPFEIRTRSITLPMYADGRPELFQARVGDNFGPLDGSSKESSRPMCSLRDNTSLRSMKDFRRLGKFHNVGEEKAPNPEFHIVVRELWPDHIDDRPRIRETFGDAPLHWWSILSLSEKQATSNARGYRFLNDPSLSRDDRAKEIERRSVQRLEEVPCSMPSGGSVENLLTCQWTPRRSGYFSVEAVGIWTLWAHEAGRIHPNHHLLNRELNSVLKPKMPGDTMCQVDTKDSPIGNAQGDKNARDRAKEDDCLLNALRWTMEGKTEEHFEVLKVLGGDFDALNPTQQLAAIAAIAGFKSDLGKLDAANPLPSKGYSQLGGKQICPAVLDFRLMCSYDGITPIKGSSLGNTADRYPAASYTTSEPVGIMVYETQVRTGSPQ